jgi:hypothetical protein
MYDLKWTWPVLGTTGIYLKRLRGTRKAMMTAVGVQVEIKAKNLKKTSEFLMLKAT